MSDDELIDEDYEIEEEFDDNSLLEDGDEDESILTGMAEERFTSLARVYKEEAPYEVLDREEIMKRQETEMSKLSGITKVPLAYCRIILQKYRWDSMKALNDWSEDSSKVCKDAGLPPPDQIVESTTSSKKGDNTCHICYDDFEPGELQSLACGHNFCTDCWKGYLTIEVKEKRKIISCPGRTDKGKCKYVVDELTVFRLLKDKESEDKYKEALIASYVEDNPQVKWCPGKGCSRALELLEFNSLKNEPVTCKCGTSFCFRCGSDEHNPATCQMSAEWRKKNTGGDEELDKQVIATISRPCPKCNTAVEKNGGCNHMMCSRCRFHFCWQCMKKFGSGDLGGTDGKNIQVLLSYGGHKCNGYFKEDAEVMDKKEELKRFEWYNDRYNNHHKSKTQEKSLLETADDVVRELLDICKLNWVSAQFYVNGINQLVKNRQILKYSYDIFENLQIDLERHTERLSNLIDKKSAKDLSRDYQAIVNQINIAGKVSTALLSAANDWNAPVDDRRNLRPKKSTSIKNDDKTSKKKKKQKVDEEDYRFKDDDWEIRDRTIKKNLENERERAQQREDDDLKKALELRKRTQSVGFADEDYDLRMAIQASLDDLK